MYKCECAYSTEPQLRFCCWCCCCIRFCHCSIVWNVGKVEDQTIQWHSTSLLNASFNKSPFQFQWKLRVVSFFLRYSIDLNAFVNQNIMHSTTRIEILLWIKKTRSHPKIIINRAELMHWWWDEKHELTTFCSNFYFLWCKYIKEKVINWNANSIAKQRSIHFIFPHTKYANLKVKHFAHDSKV